MAPWFPHGFVSLGTSSRGSSSERRLEVPQVKTAEGKLGGLGRWLQPHILGGCKDGKPWADFFSLIFLVCCWISVFNCMAIQRMLDRCWFCWWLVEQLLNSYGPPLLPPQLHPPWCNTRWAQPKPVGGRYEELWLYGVLSAVMILPWLVYYHGLVIWRMVFYHLMVVWCFIMVFIIVFQNNQLSYGI